MNQDRHLSRLYRKAAREEPRPELDRAILQAASNEGQREMRSSRRLRWQAPLALAAVLVLAVSLVLTMDGEFERTSVVDEIAREPSVVDDIAREHAYDANSRGMIEREAQLQAQDPSAMTPRQFSVPEYSMKADAPKTVLPQGAEPPALGRALDKAKDRTAASNSASAGLPPATARTPGREREEMTPGISKSSELDWKRTVEIEASRNRELRARRPRGEPAEVAKPITQPEQWLREIETLRHAGREEEARAQLDAFRKHYPDYPLPPSLR